MWLATVVFSFNQRGLIVLKSLPLGVRPTSHRECNNSWSLKKAVFAAHSFHSQVDGARSAERVRSRLGRVHRQWAQRLHSSHGLENICRHQLSFLDRVLTASLCLEARIWCMQTNWFAKDAYATRLCEGLKSSVLRSDVQMFLLFHKQWTHNHETTQGFFFSRWESFAVVFLLKANSLSWSGRNIRFHRRHEELWRVE